MNVRETPRTKPRYGIDPYMDWLAREGIPVTEDYGVYLFGVETASWPRYGVNGAAVHLKGRGDFANMFVFDIAPGKSTAPQRHLYEEVIYVLEGHGSTQLEFADGSRRSFEWGAKSLFAIPLISSSATAPASRNTSPERAISSRCGPATTCGKPILCRT